MYEHTETCLDKSESKKVKHLISRNRVSSSETECRIQAKGMGIYVRVDRPTLHDLYVDYSHHHYHGGYEAHTVD